MRAVKITGRKRVVLAAGLTTAVAALGFGGVAYAVGGDESPQRHVEIVDEPFRSTDGSTSGTTEPRDGGCSEGDHGQQPDDASDPSDQA